MFHPPGFLRTFSWGGPVMWHHYDWWEPVSDHTDLVVPDEGGDGAPRVALPRAGAHQLVQAHRARQVLKQAMYLFRMKMFFHQWEPWVYFRRHCPHPWRGVQGPSPDIKTGMRYLNHTDSAKQRWLWANSWKIKSLNDSVTGWMGPPIQLIKIRIMAIFVQWYQYHGPASSSARPGYQPTPCFHKNGPRWALRCWTTIKSCTNFHVWVINMRIIVYHSYTICVFQSCFC